MNYLVTNKDNQIVDARRIREEVLELFNSHCSNDCSTCKYKQFSENDFIE